MSAQIKQDKDGQMWVRQDDHLTWIKAKMVNASPDGSIVVETGYNGWVNYETWAVNLHLNNDRQFYIWARLAPSVDALQQMVTNKWYDMKDYLYNAAILRFARISERNRDRLSALMFGDLLISSLQCVDWDAVYKALHEGDETDV